MEVYATRDEPTLINLGGIIEEKIEMLPIEPKMPLFEPPEQETNNPWIKILCIIIAIILVGGLLYYEFYYKKEKK